MAIQKPNLCKLFEHYGQYLSQTFTIVMNITCNIGARHLLVLGIILAVLILTYKTALKLLTVRWYCRWYLSGPVYHADGFGGFYPGAHRQRHPEQTSKRHRTGTCPDKRHSLHRLDARNGKVLINR